MKKNIRRLSGFTIIELLVVIVVIGILAAIGFVSYGGIQAKARDVSVQSDIETMDALQTSYGLSHNISGKAYYSGDGYDADLDFAPSEGNVIDVVIDGDNYCIRGYNNGGTKSSIINAFEKESSEGVCGILSPSFIALSNYTGSKLFLYVAEGYNHTHTCAIAYDTNAYCWGQNADGQIGDGTSGTNRLTPTAVSTTGALAGKTIKAIRGGGSHTCAIASDNQAYCWGNNFLGEIGDGTSGTDRLTPTAVSTTGALAGKTVKAITTGLSYTCAIASDNQAYCWGQNTYGQIGDGTLNYRLTPTAVSTTGALAGKTVKAITSDSYNTCAIASDNQAYCWGRNNTGQIGDGTFGTDRLTPTAVSTTGALAGKTVKTIVGGSNHTCAIASDNQAYCWGSNAYGQIGDGTFGTDRLTPTAVSTTGALAGKTIKAIVASVSHTCAIASDNQAYCWGLNSNGETGDDGSLGTKRLTPTAVSTTGALAGKTIKNIAVGTMHTCAIASDYQAYCWGQNTYGQIGDGTSGINRLTPTAVSPLTQ